MTNRIGYVPGTFDMFHVGHLNILRRARERCDYLIVGVGTDELVESRKGRRPIVPFLERMEIVGNVRYVDDVVPQVNMNKVEAWNNLKFDVVFVGDDWKGSPSWLEIEERFAEIGVDIVYLSYTRHISSTVLRQRVFHE